eukprot:TRINITY_DN605_c0_g1_i2.p1 TRINITY_DN605_c0_g1~~TRINITY_DN605_c0_g1_i2.p1  ORF type:complete len:754 (-),score=134.82 TRINITY_DN605_c0_g1_i2:86-2347(-)
MMMMSLSCTSSATARRSSCLGLLFLSSAVLSISCAAIDTSSASSWDEAYAKATSFVGQLTLDEKVSITTGLGWGGGLCVGNINPIPRLNFPGLCLQDSPTGVRFADLASAFPASINAAQTWDKTLLYNRGVAMCEEYRGKGVNIALQPMMNMGRVAAGGRNWEGFGGDPYLQGEAAYQTILGVQSCGVIACAKHYIGNEQEHYRDQETSNIDDRTIHEVYGWPFMKSVQAGVGSFMCSYNQVNGTYACQNNRTLNQILKDEYGFRGFVMSDWWAAKTGVASALGGLDMMMPGDITANSYPLSYFGKNLTEAVNNGSVSMNRLNDMATRIMAPYYLMGQDKGFPPVSLVGKGVNVQGNHSSIIRQVGAESIVLLKNENWILPFSNKAPQPGKPTTFALIGSDAGPSPSGPNGCGGSDHGCVDGTLAQGWGSGTTNFPYLITPLQAITARASANGQSVSSSLSDWDLNAAADAASKADYALVFANCDSGEEYITVDGNMGDRNNLSLWHNADNMISKIASVNPNTIVIIHSVGPVLMPWLSSVRAVVYAGLPGQESGNALADVLFGDVNPSGKLVYTIAELETDYPAQVVYNSPQPHPGIDYTEGLYLDYRWFDAKNIQPVFEFGFGLSYTSFNYQNLTITMMDDVPENINSQNDTVVAHVRYTVLNTGRVAGAEVSQLYLGFPSGLGEPLKVLRGFEKSFLQPGGSAQVDLSLTALEVSTWSVSSQRWQVAHGQYTTYVGASSRDIRLKGSFNL